MRFDYNKYNSWLLSLFCHLKDNTTTAAGICTTKSFRCVVTYEESFLLNFVNQEVVGLHVLLLLCVSDSALETVYSNESSSWVNIISEHSFVASYLPHKHSGHNPTRV